MMIDCLVSVVIPVYNAQMYLRQNIETLLSQTYSNHELIYVDDGSTDDSKSIIEEYKQKDDRIIYRYQENRGAGAARNAGMSIARGKYIIFLDADDYFEDSLLEKTVELAETNDLDICITGAYIVDSARENKYKCFNAIMEQYLPSQEVFSVNDDPDNAFLISGPFPWNKLYRTQFLKDNQLEFQDLMSINDLSFVYFSFVKAERIAVCYEQLVNYRAGDNDGLTLNNDKRPGNIFLAYQRLKDLLKEDGSYDKYQKAFCRIASWDMLTALSRMRSLDSFHHLYRMLKNEYIIQLDLYNHSEDYYIGVDHREQIETIMQCVAEEYLFYLLRWNKRIVSNQEYMIYERDNWIRERDEIIGCLNNDILNKNRYKNWYFPEENYPAATSFVLYGFGKVGKDFARQLVNSKHSELVAVIDKNTDAIDEPYLKATKVGDMSILSDLEYDYIIISPRKTDVAKHIRADLLDAGVEETKIICPILEESNE